MLAPASLLALAFAAAPVDAWKTLPTPAAMPKPSREGRVPVEGASIAYAVFGEGEPVFLLHGGAGSSDQWGNQVPALAERFKVIVVDARGHGRSTTDQRPFSYALMAADLLAVMDRLEVRRAALVGWSDGGIVALDLALHHPDRVTKLVAFGVNTDLSGLKSGGGPAVSAYFARCASEYARLSPTPGDYKVLRDGLRQMWKAQPAYTADELARLPVPTLLLDGDHDELIREEHLEQVAKRIPHARVELIAGASHFALWQQPAAFNKAVLAFLNEK